MGRAQHGNSNCHKENYQATACSIIRRLRGGSANVENVPTQDKQDNTLLNPGKRLDPWKEYFKQLINVSSNTDPSMLHRISPASISPKKRFRQDRPSSLNEVQLAMKQMENGKAPGNDNISADLLKAGGRPTVTWLREIINHI